MHGLYSRGPYGYGSWRACSRSNNASSCIDPCRYVQTCVHASPNVHTRVCTNVHTHVYAHVYTHVRTHVYTHVYTHAYTNAYTRTCLNTCPHTCLCKRVHSHLTHGSERVHTRQSACMRACLCTCLHTCQYACPCVSLQMSLGMPAYAHGCTHVCAHIYTHVCTHVCTHISTHVYTLRSFGSRVHRYIMTMHMSMRVSTVRPPMHFPHKYTHAHAPWGNGVHTTRAASHPRLPWQATD